jgi:transposase
VTGETETLARDDEAYQRLMTVPGIGPIIASAMVATIGDGSAFRRGRDFGAWLGLVPQQISARDRTILGRISKRGNSYLRMLFVQAAPIVLLRALASYDVLHLGNCGVVSGSVNDQHPFW